MILEEKDRVVTTIVDSRDRSFNSEQRELKQIFDSMTEHKKRESPPSEFPKVSEEFLEYCARKFFRSGYEIPFVQFVIAEHASTMNSSLRGKLVIVNEKANTRRSR